MAEPSATKVLQQPESKLVLFKEKKFLLLWMAGLLSNLGFYGFSFAEAWYIVHALNLEALLGLIYMASSIPRVIFMMVGGVTADRISRSKIMFLSDLSRAFLLAVLIVLLLMGTVSIWTFAGLALFFGIFDAFFMPAESSLLPEIVPKSQLTRANSLVQTTNQTAIIVAPIIGGFVIAWGNFILAFGLMGAFLIMSAILVFFVKSSRSENEEDEESKNFTQSAKEGLLYMKKIPWLYALLITAALLNFLMVGPLTMGLPLFVDNILNGSALDYSLMESVFAVGMGVGAFLTGIVNISKKRGLASLGAVGMSSLFFLILSLSFQQWQALTLIFLFGTMMSATNIITISMIQEKVSDRVIGRVMGVLMTISGGLIPISYALTSLVLAGGIPINAIMFSGAALVLLVSLFILIKVPTLRKLD